MKAKFVIPLALFLILVVFLWVGLRLNPREVPSPLIGKPAPQFDLTDVHDPGRHFSNRDMLGKVWLLNVYASWCESCREEHPLLVEFSGKQIIPIIGLDYKDKPEDARKWLNQMGNPYELSVSDLDGRVGINFGVYGVPETYLIDKAGIIRDKIIGPITVKSLDERIIPRARELSQ
ncbi:MAG: DsbE family thiol:disulfide interchange protein [Burkholderiales bacterium]|nr:DsbE family thiol:disulfide interchange protein [Burkholderiales bacterium]